LNYASNAVGTVTDVRKFIELAHEAGAITTVDAVHYAAHHPIDVKSIDADILVCSAYKFFGPHIGVVYIREELFEKLRTIRVDADDILVPPIKFQTGTPNFEHICGAGEAINFIADIGEKFGACFDAETTQLSGRRRQVVKGMLAIDAYEESLAFRLRSELRKIPGVRVYGPAEGDKRTTTVSFTVAGKNSNEVALALANEGIYTWDGDFYAITLVNEVLGLGKQGGLVRIGFAPYNLMDDVDRVLDVIKSL
jgi:selenocysteine lyase/cysteine desulfurase